MLLVRTMYNYKVTLLFIFENIKANFPCQSTQSQIGDNNLPSLMQCFVYHSYDSVRIHLQDMFA